MRIAGIAPLAVFGVACGGAQGASDRPRIVAADSAFRADSATLAAIVARDAAERRRIAGTRTSDGFAPYTGGGPAAPAAFSSTDQPPAPKPAPDTAGARAANTDVARVHAVDTYEAADPRPWNRPYVAVLDRKGNVAAQWDGATNLAAIDAAIRSQLAR